MKKKMGVFFLLIMIITLTACSDVVFDPVTINGFTVTTAFEQSIDQGKYDFVDDEIVGFLPDLNYNAPSQNFTFSLELIQMDLDDEEVIEIFSPLPEASSIVIQTEGSAIFEEMTFYHAGVYTFRISQSPLMVEGWAVDQSFFDLVVTVTEDEVYEVLRADVQSYEDVVFHNQFTLYIEEMLTLLFESIEFRMQSEYALLINLSTGEILFEHQANVRTFPASVTKIMTVLVGLASGEMDESITVNADFDGLYLSQAMQSGFVYGEVRTLSEILHAVLLTSGGEATEALANHVGGSYEAFVELMNIKAEQLGMNDTHFVTATGLHDENHYTTANDIAILLQYALEIPAFREMFTRPSYELEIPNSITDTLHSTLFHFAPTTEFEGGRILGGRTGYTTPAGLCLASLATDGVDEFILITFGAREDDGSRTAHVLDALMIYEYFLR